jgi:ElaB/YqjD/DUF883 family membrane-anchored ribosome-binding protein
VPNKVIIDEAAAGAHGMIDRTAQGAHHAVDKTASVAVPALDWDWLSAKTDRLTTAPVKHVEGGRQTVIDHPWYAIGITFACGVLVGRMLR